MEDNVKFQTIACLTTSYNNIIEDIVTLEKDLTKKKKYKPCELMAFTNFHNLLSAFVELIDEQELKTIKDYKNIHDLYFRLFDQTLIKKDEYKQLLQKKLKTDTEHDHHVCSLHNDLYFDFNDNDKEFDNDARSLYS